MAGVVFIVCVPTEAREIYLCSTQEKKPDTNHSDIQTNMLKGVNVPKHECFLSNANDSIKLSNGTSEQCFIPMIKIVENILEKFNITNAVWYRGLGDYVQVVFPSESQEESEAILYRLSSNNVGKLRDSTVSVLPCSVHYSGHNNNIKVESDTETGVSESDENTWSKIVSSKNTRLTVDQIVETVKVRATFTFDFVCLILISTTMCALGLVENSTVYLLSSMVMSPMMGPVMAATFGSVIRDSHLKKIGVQNELMGLGIAMLVGFCYGIVTCMITDKYGSQEWPTYEITSRGELRSLWIGCIIALLSGAAVALGILSDNIASLVGVAISTSLMPPAVNAGLLWSMALVYYLKGNATTRYSSLQYIRHYSDNDLIELLVLGAISICLTVVNILCIYVAAICIFKVKEVAPIASRDKEKLQFWKYDIRNARYNNTLQREEGKRIHNAFASLKNRFRGARDDFHHSSEFTSVKDKILDSRNQSTWSHGYNVKQSHLGDNQRSTWSVNRPGGSARRLSSIFAEHCQDKSKKVVCQKKVRIVGKREHFSDSSDDHGAQITSDSQLIQTKSKTFIVTPCKSAEDSIPE